MVEYYEKGKSYAPGTVLKWKNGTKIQIQQNGGHKIVSMKKILSKQTHEATAPGHTQDGGTLLVKQIIPHVKGTKYAPGTMVKLSNDMVALVQQNGGYKFLYNARTRARKSKRKQFKRLQDKINKQSNNSYDELVGGANPTNDEIESRLTALDKTDIGAIKNLLQVIETKIVDLDTLQTHTPSSEDGANITKGWIAELDSWKKNLLTHFNTELSNIFIKSDIINSDETIEVDRNKSYSLHTDDFDEYWLTLYNKEGLKIGLSYTTSNSSKDIDDSSPLLFLQHVTESNDRVLVLKSNNTGEDDIIFIALKTDTIKQQLQENKTTIKTIFDSHRVPSQKDIKKARAVTTLQAKFRERNKAKATAAAVKAAQAEAEAEAARVEAARVEAARVEATEKERAETRAEAEAKAAAEEEARAAAEAKAAEAKTEEAARLAAEAEARAEEAQAQAKAAEAKTEAARVAAEANAAAAPATQYTEAAPAPQDPEAAPDTAVELAKKAGALADGTKDMVSHVSDSVDEIKQRIESLETQIAELKGNLVSAEQEQTKAEQEQMDAEQEQMDAEQEQMDAETNFKTATEALATAQTEAASLTTEEIVDGAGAEAEAEKQKRNVEKAKRNVEKAKGKVEIATLHLGSWETLKKDQAEQTFNTAVEKVQELKKSITKLENDLVKEKQLLGVKTQKLKEASQEAELAEEDAESARERAISALNSSEKQAEVQEEDESKHDDINQKLDSIKSKLEELSDCVCNPIQTKTEGGIGDAFSMNEQRTTEGKNAAAPAAKKDATAAQEDTTDATAAQGDAPEKAAVVAKTDADGTAAESISKKNKNKKENGEKEKEDGEEEDGGAEKDEEEEEEEEDEDGGATEDDEEDDEEDDDDEEAGTKKNDEEEEEPLKDKTPKQQPPGGEAATKTDTPAPGTEGQNGGAIQSKKQIYNLFRTPHKIKDNGELEVINKHTHKMKELKSMLFFKTSKQNIQVGFIMVELLKCEVNTDLSEYLLIKPLTLNIDNITPPIKACNKKCTVDNTKQLQRYIRDIFNKKQFKAIFDNPNKNLLIMYILDHKNNLNLQLVILNSNTNTLTTFDEYMKCNKGTTSSSPIKDSVITKWFGK